MSIIAVLLSASASLAQKPLGEAYWQRMRRLADSVLVNHFGQEFRTKHIFNPREPTMYMAFGDESADWLERDTVSRIPTYCHFEYDIGFDSLHASHMNIALDITPQGNRLQPSIEPGAEWNGFVNCSGSCSFKYDLNGFIKLARDGGIKCRKRDAYEHLEWIPPDSSEQAMGVINGRYEVTLAGRKLRHEVTKLMHSTYTSDVYEAIVFDPFTGAILRRTEIDRNSQWACWTL